MRSLNLGKNFLDSVQEISILRSYKFKIIEADMGQKAEIRLDVLIKREEDCYLAHCLQLDIVTTADTLEEAKKDIIDLCRAHIEYSYKYNNLDYLFSPAPKEVWAEYLKMSQKEGCDVENTRLDDSFHINSLSCSVQKIYCYA